MHHIAVARPLGLFVLVTLVGCGDDVVETADGSASASSTSTGTGGEPSTGVTPTTGGATASTSGMSEAMTSTTSGTTEGIDPTTGTTSAGTSAGSTSTGPETSTTETGDSSTGSSTGGSSSTGEVCEDGVVCDGTIAVMCKDGVETQEDCGAVCIDGVGCAGCALPMTEVCDGVDNDCDGVVDGGDVCPPASCFGGGGGCSELPVPPPTPLVSGCAQQFPPAASLPCPIPEPGEVFHVSATSGNDANDGTSPGQAWKTLCHAIEAAPEGSTLRVAEGKYTSASVYVGKSLTVKGGFDATFSDWDPDAHPSEYFGRVMLDHNNAVFGGFKMISNPLHADAWSYGHHFIGAGTLVRNYIEMVATSGQEPNILNFYGIIASACPSGVTVLRCNDIYVRASAPQTFVVSAVEYGNQALHAGQAVLDANRICQDGGGGATDAVGGYGSCFPEPVSLLARNNVIEKAGFGGGEAMSFYSCGSGDMALTLTNNTILTSGDGIRSSGDPAVMMDWKITNNIVFNMSGGTTAIDVGDAGVQISTSEGNLTFGFANNAISPPPLVTMNDDTSGVATPVSVFNNANAGDLSLKPGGQGVDTGINVFGLPEYGTVTTDAEQVPRPLQGQWDRGALGQ